MTILDKIIARKKKEVVTLKKEHIYELNERFLSSDDIPSFYETVKNSHTMSIIAEIKRASPSKGIINDDVNPVEQARTYVEHGATAISVLTDTPFFKGTMDDLLAVRKVVDVPILCKDFIIDPIQIDRAKAHGANIILLIAAALNDMEIDHLFHYAKEANLEVLLEVHNETEVERALSLGAKLIGINNRNLKTFTVDLKTTERLISSIKDRDIVIVSESGIKDVDDVREVRNAGAKAILVGETFMKANDVGKTIRSFQLPLS